MDIAIIGSGISGLTAAHLLSKKHQVSVFECADKIGGHTATIDVDYDSEKYNIDTGFIVFNDWTYPNFIKLMDQLGVESKPTTMGFSMLDPDSGLEYSGASFATLFAQRKNLLSLKHWGMLRDIVKFNKLVLRDLKSNNLSSDTTLDQYLDQNRFGEAFRKYYLLPMASAIWSTGMSDMGAVPILFFAQFFKNHGLLSVVNRPQWRVIKGGSGSYLEPLSAAFSDRIFVNQNIKKIIRSNDSVTLHFADGSVQAFDEIVIATHSDQALKLLHDPSDIESSVLGDMGYSDNDVVLHTDIRQLPKRKETWSSWNYQLTPNSNHSAAVTYHMNILQGIESSHDFLVTLNNSQAIDPTKIIAEFNYAHPMFDSKSIAAQQRWEEINGVNRTWYCGAYWRNGFHEDGVASGLRVAQAFGIDLDTERDTLLPVAATNSQAA